MGSELFQQETEDTQNLFDQIKNYPSLTDCKNELFSSSL